MKKDMSYKTLESRYLIKRPWLTARCDKVQMPNGTVNDEYWVLEYPDWVNIIAITDDDRFLFVRQYRYALGKTVDEICAGVCEQGEKTLETAQRELLEETGYGGGEWHHLMSISANASTHTNLCHCFVAKGVSKQSAQHLDATEDIEVELFTRAEVLQMLRNGEIWQSLMAAPLWRYFCEERL